MKDLELGRRRQVEVGCDRKGVKELEKGDISVRYDRRDVKELRVSVRPAKHINNSQEGGGQESLCTLCQTH